MVGGGESRFASAEYPDGLARLWAALTAPHAGDILISAQEGYEFVDWGGVTHCPGGSHGALAAGDSLGPLLLDPGPQLRFCLGYAGWGHQQLEQEIQAGSWLYVEASARPVLKGDPGLLWESTLRSMGVDPALLSKGMGKGLN